MRNPWRMQDGPNNQINRNNFPMSFQYNGTFRYGKIYPVGLWRTIPGATYQIDPTLALNFMPTTFPIQTRQRAYVHFFYGRDRNFWSDYKDFVNGMKPDLVKPYLDTAITKPTTGSLLDYLGVPTTIVGSYGSTEELPFNFSTTSDGGLGLPYFSEKPTRASLEGGSGSPAWYSLKYSKEFGNAEVQNDFNSFNISQLTDFNGQAFGFRQYNSVYVSDVNRTLSYVDVNIVTSEILGTSINDWLESPFTTDQSIYLPEAFSRRADAFAICALDSSGNVLEWSFSPELANQGVLRFNLTTTEVISKICVFVPNTIRWVKNGSEVGTFAFVSADGIQHVYPSSIVVKSTQKVDEGEVRDINDDTSPYWRSGTTDFRSRIKLNAIPCRMYETIYNLYYRNPQNNPYILDGKPEYNKFIPSKDGGVDSNLYELRYRNWEDDFLTTAVQSPQQGIAPLVGLTDRGATVTLTNDDGSVTRYVTNLDENGNVTGIETTDSSEPMLTQALIDAVSYGISIEDLRNVNAMQKWLELNLRKGYQYKDIIEARWGISISYNELDLPEFIGGFTQEVGMQAVTQTANIDDTITGQLGWQAGRMYCAGEGRQITHYCEEEGYIMAMLCVVPVPNYSQLLPKHWFTRDLLDSYQPEFNHIGFQPITYKEVCPIQAYQESTENVDVLEQTFGYQRPWYEYFNQVDEVHGQFRTTLKDYLINRVFNVKPELSESFLLVDPDQINDVFNVTEDDDKILGAINYRITAKLPISLYAQARLE